MSKILLVLTISCTVCCDQLIGQIHGSILLGTGLNWSLYEPTGDRFAGQSGLFVFPELGLRFERAASTNSKFSLTMETCASRRGWANQVRNIPDSIPGLYRVTANSLAMNALIGMTLCQPPGRKDESKSLRMNLGIGISYHPKFKLESTPGTLNDISDEYKDFQTHFIMTVVLRQPFFSKNTTLSLKYEQGIGDISSARSTIRLRRIVASIGIGPWEIARSEKQKAP